MTIIIGTGQDAPTPDPLGTVDVDLPHPASAPANTRVLDDGRLIELLEHEHPLVRGFAVEQIGRFPAPELLDALTTRFEDDDESVAVEAISVVDEHEHESARDALLAAFSRAEGPRMVALASALATVAPERLLEAVQARGRLDSQSYGAVASALATTGTEPVLRFFDKALNRSGALSPDRRGALYTAVLLSGDPALTTRVLTKAVDDSKQEAPKDASFPSRAALATLAGLSLAATRPESSGELLKHARALIERDVTPALTEAQASALQDALVKEQPQATLSALAPVVAATEDLETPRSDDAHPRRAASIARRRRGLLSALVARADDVGRLEVGAAALFVAVAARAAAAALSGELDEAKSEGIDALAKALERDDPATLAKSSEADWTELFASKSPRDIRRVVTTVVRSSFYRVATLRALTRALMAAGHGRALLDALAEVQEDTGIHQLVIEAMTERAEEAEAVVVEVLTETPLPEEVAPVALMLAALVRTERVAAAVGRRFYDLRKVGRMLTAQVVLRTADPRLLPLVKSRAFEQEPEETAWVVLALVHGEERTEALSRVLDRMSREARRPEHDHDQGGQDHDQDQGPRLEVPLHCEVCGETLRYRFDRAFVDAEAKDDLGDPAFVGPMVCKACGTADQLKPTAETSAILTQHMLAYLQAVQQGVPPEQPPLVSPARTNVAGKSMGLAAALRALDTEVAASPDSIRTRLHRARTRIILRRSGVDEDLDHVKSIDADSVEADALLAMMALRERDYDRSAQLTVGALKRLRREPEPRLYDAEDIDELRESLEGYLLELTDLGVALPEDYDLSGARRGRERRMQTMRMLEEQRRSQEEEEDEAEPEPTPDAGRAEVTEAFKHAGRNDPCPCGSGKKFKRCHGR